MSEQKRFTLTIKDHATGETHTHDTNALLGSFIGREFGQGNSDTSQFMFGQFTEKEFIKSLAGMLNNAYHATGSLEGGEKLVQMAAKVAKEGYKVGAFKAAKEGAPMPKSTLVKKITPMHLASCEQPSVAVFNSPDDQPGKYVARLFDKNLPTNIAIIEDSLDEVRAGIPFTMVKLDRTPFDHPNIVEVWI